MWQDESFEHQVRLSDSIEDYAFYIFMNPYKAGLCPLNEGWPWWICPEPLTFRFLGLLASNEPVPALWLGLGDEIAGRIETGE